MRGVSHADDSNANKRQVARQPSNDVSHSAVCRYRWGASVCLYVCGAFVYGLPPRRELASMLLVVDAPPSGESMPRRQLLLRGSVLNDK